MAQWLMPQLKKIDAATFELLDLKDYPLSFFDEANSPMGLERNYTSDVAKQWSAKVDSMDGFIVITPEYNHGTSAVLKNALDWLYPEWNCKPVGFVSYSPNAVGGVRAVEQLRLNAIELQMVPIHQSVHITHVLDTISEDGKLLQGHLNEHAASFAGQLVWWAKVLQDARGRGDYHG